MARHLAIDWDYHQLRIVAATVRAGKLHLEQAAVWQEEHSPNIAEAKALGHHLRERLKAAGIAPAPVLACVGRDRVILREVRYPCVAAAEEPAVIRFQVMKELTDSANEVVIDYAPLGEAAPGEERRALVLTVRRELLAAYQTLCHSAGLKLLAVTPRPFGTLACLRASMKKREGNGTYAELHKGGTAQAAVAVLTAADSWSEFCLVHDDTVLVARSLPAGPTLAAEVRRNIAVYSAQSPRHTVSGLYLAGNGETPTLRESLQEALGIPVRTFDPFLDAEEGVLPAQNRGAFAGAVGLLRAQGDGQPLPINFVSPKQPQAARDPNKRRLAVAGGIAALLLIGLVSYCYSQLAALDSQLEGLRLEKKELESQIPQLVQERFEALNVWWCGNITWLDELYDLTVLMPDHKAILLSEILVDATAKDKPAAKLTLKGGTTRAGDAVDSLLAQMQKDKPHYKPSPRQSSNQSRKDFPTLLAMPFTAEIAVEKQLPDKYDRRLTVPYAVTEGPWPRPFPEKQLRPASLVVGGKKIAVWQQSSHVLVKPPPASPAIPARPAVLKTNPQANELAAPAPVSNFERDFRELMDTKAAERGEIPTQAPPAEGGQRPPEPYRKVVPRSVPVTAPAVEKGKKK